LNPSSIDQLAKADDVVWTLKYLAWFEDSFEQSLRLLFLLATRVDESRAKTAMGAFADVFLVHLGATSVAYQTRLEVLQRLLEEYGSDQARALAVRSLMNAFRLHEARFAPIIQGGVILPEEWLPRNYGEERSVRLSAWEMLLREVQRIADAPVRNQVLVEAADSLASIFKLLPVESVMPGLRSLQWPDKAKAKLTQQVRMTLEFDATSKAQSELLQKFVDELKGDTLQAQLSLVFSADPWELAENRKERLAVPKSIVDLATQVAADPAGLSIALELASSGKPTTVGLLFECMAPVLNNRDASFETIKSHEPLVVAAVAGFLAGRDKMQDQDWVSAQLKELVEVPRLVNAFPSSLYAVASSDYRAQMAIAAIKRGAIRGRQLTILLYGSWCAVLTESTLIELLRAMSEDDNPFARESAVGILETYVEGLAEISAGIQTLTVELLLKAQEGTQMLPYYRQQLLKKVPVDYRARLVLWLEAFLSSEGTVLDSDIELFDGLVRERPEETLGAMVDALLGDIRQRGWSRWGMQLEESSFISRAVGIAGPDPVLKVLQGRSEDELRSLMPHFAFGEKTPDLVLQWIIGQSSDDKTLRVATGEFLTNPHVWWGSRVTVLEERRNTALVWAGMGNWRFQSWARNLIPVIDAEIEREKGIEARFEPLQ
jgi:hypothetical protein